jgi:outer membrane protein
MKYIILILTLFSLSFISLNAQKQWTLQECIDTALANNRNIKQRELIRRQNEIAYRQAYNNLLPSINATGNQSWDFGRSDIYGDSINRTTSTTKTNYGISGNITLFDGLRMKYNIDARMSELKNSEAGLDKTRQDIVLSVSTAFLQVLLNKELLNIAEEQLVLTKKNIDQKKSLVESGKLAEGEMFELYAQQAQEEVNSTQAENTLKLSLLDLAQILELTDFEAMDIVVPVDLINNELQVLNPEEVYKIALENRPEVKSAEYQLKTSETNVRIAQSAYFPTLSFGANVTGGYYNSQTTPFSTSLGFTLSVPIFNKLETTSQVRTAKIDVETNRLNVDNAKLELRKTIQQTYYNAVAAKARWDAAQKSETANEEAFRYATQKYENDRITVYELYQAKSNLTRALSELTQAKYEYVFRLKILELYAQ